MPRAAVTPFHQAGLELALCRPDPSHSFLWRAAMCGELTVLPRLVARTSGSLARSLRFPQTGGSGLGRRTAIMVIPITPRTPDPSRSNVPPYGPGSFPGFERFSSATGITLPQG
jgi:hypothetical protein